MSKIIQEQTTFPGKKQPAANKPKIVSPSCEIVVGELPETHMHAGEFAAQIMLMPFDNRQDAEEAADELKRLIETFFGAPGGSSQ